MFLLKVNYFITNLSGTLTVREQTNNYICKEPSCLQAAFLHICNIQGRSCTLTFC